MSKYLILSRCEDDVSIDSMTKEELTKNLAENYWGPDVQFMSQPPESLEEFPAHTLFIMKGEIVVPKAKKVVETYEVI